MSGIFKTVKRTKPSSVSRVKFLRLDKNERVTKFPNNFIKIFKKQINSESLNIYPELFKFYGSLSKNHSLGRNYFFATAGIDAGLRSCIELFGDKKIIILDPTFAMINIYCSILKKKIIKVGYNKEFNLDLETIYQNLNSKISLVVLSNPNSPTGTALNVNQIKKILIKSKKFNIKVVIDEAYYGFCKITCSHMIKKFSNLIILRTFSKAYGVAGLRVGYAISQPKNIKKMINIKPMYEANSLGILAANILLKNQKISKDYLDQVKIGKEFLLRFFDKKKIRYMNSEGNFILFKIRKNKQTYFKRLKKKNIRIVEKFSHKNLQGFSRLTLAPKKEMYEFIKIFKSY